MACWRGVCRYCRGTGTEGDATAGDHLQTQPSFRAVSSTATIQQFYDMQDDEIGVGVSGIVMKAMCRSTGVIHAVKILKKTEALANSKELENEIELTRSMHHPNIIKFFDTFEDSCHIFIVMELCAGGELFDEIIAAGELSEHRAAFMVRQVCEGLRYIHTEGICHRDLKPEHLICTEKGPLETSHVKIVDFGLSRRFKENEVLTTAVGTALYAAPEVIKQSYSSACDLWSCGVIVYCLLCGRLPFDGETPREVVKNVRKARYSLEGELWDPVSENAKNLIRQLLVKDTQVRLTAALVLEHNWIKNQASNSCGSLGQPVVDNLRAFMREATWAKKMLCNRDVARNLSAELSVIHPQRG